MERIFRLETATEHKLVVIEINGARMSVIQRKADGSIARCAKELKNDAEARSACEKMARELTSRGFVEQAPSTAMRSRQPAPAAAAAKPAAKTFDDDRLNVGALFDDEDFPARPAAEPVLERLPAAPASATAAPKKKKKKSGGKKGAKKQESSGDLDKRVIAVVIGVGLALVGMIGYFAYDAFLKPATIVGAWAGSMVEFETGKPMVYTQYALTLDEDKKAALTLQEKFTSTGTYNVKGNRLNLSFKDEDGYASERQYKIALRRSTLDLFDPNTNKKVVQLIRLRENPVSSKPAAPKAPSEVALSTDKIDKAADDRLVSVEFSPKDGAFKLRHPQGWETATGSRPDNMYSWGSFTKGSAKIQVFADTAGSLMSGSPAAGNYEEGSELAPVHRAHELYKKTASEEYSDYSESKPTLFKGSPLGEGRVAIFTASGGFLGPKLRGYRVTLLTNDRRISILCHCPESDFTKLKPTFLALCRSLSR